MKIITASKFYYLRAGLEAYMLKITDALRQNGHEVIPFSTTYKENIKTDYDEYFSEYTGIGGDEKHSLITKINAFSKIFYNYEARNKIKKLMDKTKPDLLWGFGVHRHLSPAIFMEAKSRSIPVVHRLSDYAIICPCAVLSQGDNSLCDDLLCPTKGYHNAIINRCVRLATPQNPSKEPSLAASVIGAMELTLHHNFKFYINNVDKFIAPSNCLKNIMIKAGLPEEKLVHIPIFIDPNLYEPEYDSDPYLLYVGRLSREKGLPLLLGVMKELKQHKLIIVGDGPQKDYLEKLQQEQNIDNVEFKGRLQGEALKNVVKKSRFVVIPSTWYENSPNVLLEAYAQGKPVLGASIGGIPEYIEENETGFKYNHDNSEELKEKIDFLMNNPELCKSMGKKARSIIETKYSPSVHYEIMSNFLKDVIINNN